MKFRFVVLMLASTVLMSTSAGADAASNCSEIADADERLACFDREFPRVDEQQPAAPDATVNSSDLPDEATAETRKVLREEPAPDHVTPTPAEPSDRFGFPRKGGSFSKQGKVEINSRIKSVRRREQQKMVFLLENNQIWIQHSPRPLPISGGDMMTITSATIGGYMLTTEHGTTTRVRRIQ